MNLRTSVINGLNYHKIDKPIYNGPYGILARNVNAKWSPEDATDSIKNITFEIKQGECFGICGSFGDGKVLN